MTTPSTSAGLETTSLPPFGLPRARALTDALLAPVTDPPDQRVRARLEERLQRAVVALRGPADNSARGILRLSAYELGRALEPPGRGRSAAAPPDGPSRTGPGSETFRWTPRRARRVIGLAAVSVCVDGMAGNPAEAARLVMSDPARLMRAGAQGPGSCADWVTTLPPAPRAVVLAEAVTWASQLWTAIEWDRAGPSAVVGPSDRWWGHGGSTRVMFRGRVDVRVTVSGGSTCLCMLGGHPTRASRTMLLLAPLVDLLRLGPGRTPSRVIGWWPESGKAWIVPVDAASLTAAADVVALGLRAYLTEAAGGPRGNGAPDRTL